MYNYFSGKITSYATSYCPRKDARRTTVKFQGEATIAVRGNYFVSSKDVNSRQKVETGEWTLGRGIVEVYYGTVLGTSASLLTQTTINIKFIL